MREDDYRLKQVELEKIEQALRLDVNKDNKDLLRLRNNICNYLSKYFRGYEGHLVFNDPPLIFMALKLEENIETNVFLDLSDLTLNKEVANKVVATEKFDSYADINNRIFNRYVDPNLLLSYPYDPLEIDEDHDGITARYDVDDRDDRVQSYFPDKSLRYEMEQYQEEAVKKNSEITKNKNHDLER